MKKITHNLNVEPAGPKWSGGTLEMSKTITWGRRVEKTISGLGKLQIYQRLSPSIRKKLSKPSQQGNRTLRVKKRRNGVKGPTTCAQDVT